MIHKKTFLLKPSRLLFLLLVLLQGILQSIANAQTRYQQFYEELMALKGERIPRCECNQPDASTRRS